jgi:hypothetical protein
MNSEIARAAIAVKEMNRAFGFYTRAPGVKKAFEPVEPKNGKSWIAYLV